MAITRLTPLAGMNTVEEDAALQRGGDAPRLYVRDALNVDISPAGKASLRPDVQRVSAQPYRDLWQSPLHRDCFARLGQDWVKLDPTTWSHEVLAPIGPGSISYAVVNNQVLAAGSAGIFAYNGQRAERLTLDEPAPPLVIVDAGGTLNAGSYAVALSWLRHGLESPLSPLARVEVESGAVLTITLPLCLDASVTHARLYLSRADGTEVLAVGEYAVDASAIRITALPDLGAAAQFRHLAPMPSGKYLHYWRGRLLTAQANVLRFSEALAYHLHDPRHGFVQLPQRITFVAPVDGGIWVGQVDHVVFLAGTQLAELSLVRKACRAPVPDSAVLVAAEVVGDMAEGGATTALWLAENGYVAGTASGQTIELHAGVLSGISAEAGTSVVFQNRALTVVR